MKCLCLIILCMPLLSFGIVFKNVKIIDVEKSSISPLMQIKIQDDIIIEIGLKVNTQKDERIID